MLLLLTLLILLVRFRLLLLLDCWLLLLNYVIPALLEIPTGSNDRSLIDLSINNPVRVANGGVLAYYGYCY